MVQWLRFYTSNAGGSDSIPGWRTKISHAIWHSGKKKKKRGRWAKRKGTLERVEITLASLILSWAILLEALQGFPV